MTTSGTTNDEWYDEWQQVTLNDSKWQQITMSNNKVQQAVTNENSTLQRMDDCHSFYDKK